MLDWHLKWYSENEPQKHCDGKAPRIYQTVNPKSPIPNFKPPAPTYQLTTAEKKRILLDHIYGVDIDPQAVEVTKLSLLLKVLEGETRESIQRQLFAKARALPDLSNNIKCGNSLIGPDFWQDQQMELFDEEERLRINTFDWQAEFPAIFEGENPGFDAVIENPPYIFTRNKGIDEASKSYFYNNYNHQSVQLNTFGLFVERCRDLMRETGKLGFITPNNWLTIDTFSPLQGFLLKNSGDLQIINILDRVFAAANVDTAITVFRKSPPSHLYIGEMADRKLCFSERVAISELHPPAFIIQIGLLSILAAKEFLRRGNIIT